MGRPRDIEKSVGHVPCQHCSLVFSNIVKRLELDVDKTNTPDLSGVATKSDTMGNTYGLGISIYDSDNNKNIENYIMVIICVKDFLMLGVSWFYYVVLYLESCNV